MAILGCTLLASCGDNGRGHVESVRGLSYQNERIRSAPWSVHIAKMDRAEATLELQSVLSDGTVLGLSPLSHQVRSIPVERGQVLAAVNGDFYAREGTAYAGDPRGLQIVQGELVSGPGEQAAFWIDANGEPHATNVQSRFEVTWPDGRSFPFGLNEERGSSRMVLYTGRLGKSTRNRGNGLEMVLEHAENGPWLPLRVGERYQARVRSVQQGGNTALTSDTMVLSVGGALASSIPTSAVGTVLTLETQTVPGLRGARTAIGGGSVIARDGRVVRVERPANPTGMLAYSINSMFERHPRAMMGWNKTHYFLCEVDGRQRNVSVGMTLAELGEYMVRIGCDAAMSLDGGGSATFWYEGRVRNSPCDGEERPVANGLVVMRKNVERVAASAAGASR